MLDLSTFLVLICTLLELVLFVAVCTSRKRYGHDLRYDEGLRFAMLYRSSPGHTGAQTHTRLRLFMLAGSSGRQPRPKSLRGIRVERKWLCVQMCA